MPEYEQLFLQWREEAVRIGAELLSGNVSAPFTGDVREYSSIEAVFERGPDHMSRSLFCARYTRIDGPVRQGSLAEWVRRKPRGQNARHGLKWLRLAAAQGYASALNDVGSMYQLGQGLNQDFETAAEWYRKASDQGVAAARINLGFLCLDGKGVPAGPMKVITGFISGPRAVGFRPSTPLL